MLWFGSRRTPFVGRGPADDRGSGNQGVRVTPARVGQRGQTLVLFAASIVVLLGLCALVIDVSWYWANTLRLQKAADAAALAGAVQLPGNVQLGQQLSVAEAQRNGYTQPFSNNCTPGTTPYICAVQDTNPHQMDVTMTAQVQTFFMRLFGINSLQAHVTSEAQFTLPVPMGSPDQYYGDFGPVRNESSFAGPAVASTASKAAGAAAWSSSSGGQAVATDLSAKDFRYAYASSTTQEELLGGFGLSVPSGSTISGIKVSLLAWRSGGSCSVRVSLSANGGTSWGTSQTQSLTSSEPATSYVLGSDSAAWGQSWTTSNLANFSVLLVPSGACTVNVDQLQVTVIYSYTETLSGPAAACPGSVPSCYQDGGQTLAPRGFWGTMLTQGADAVNGDAYLPISSSTRLSSNPQNTADYYDYAIWVPPNSTGVQVYIYDPGFCATDTGGQYGTGDRYFGSGSVSSFYDLYKVNTPYNLPGDTYITGSGALFQDIGAQDGTMGGSTGGSQCTQDGTVYMTSGQQDGRNYHDRWWQIPLAGTPYAATGLTGGASITGTTYRLRTTTDPKYNPTTSTLSGSPYASDDQSGVDAQNSFAIYASSGTSGTPQVYGLGAMEMFTPLTGGANARFFLAQIDANSGAGKTMEINLWDPGDTGSLSAKMNVLEPCVSGASCTINVADPNPGTTDTWTYEYADISTLKAVEGVNDGNGSCATNAKNASAGAAQGKGFVTSQGNGGLYNGCWVTMEIPIDPSYTAPDDGWWMIEYDMTGSGGAYDLTTWQVNLVGNPVHLVVP